VLGRDGSEPGSELVSELGSVVGRLPPPPHPATIAALTSATRTFAQRHRPASAACNDDPPDSRKMTTSRSRLLGCEPWRSRCAAL
jgi:hypothetical protein